MMKRNALRNLALAGAGVMLLLWGGSVALAQAPELLDARAHPKFVTPVPNPLDPSFIFAPDGTVPGPMGPEDYYEIGMFEFYQHLGLFNEMGMPLMTKVWGYGKDMASATYPGRTLLAYRDVPLNVLWTNDLVDENNDPLPHFLPVDPTVHTAVNEIPGWTPEGGPIPVVTHVHGGHTESASDGLPEAWFTPGFVDKGKYWKKDVYHYDNDQEAGTIWYHDHALGITRLNVYAGLAGFYILRDEFDTGMRDNPLGLPVFPYEIPIVIQDRMFTADGQLYYPSEPEEPGQPEPSVLPEFFGDFILVNGVAWPVMDVEPRKYRVRLLNGSDSRFYDMWLTEEGTMAAGSGPRWFQIGTDLGLLYAPVKLSKLTLGPGERADTIIDFSDHAGMTLILRNNARSPFPKGDTVDPQTAGQIMAFRVSSEPVEDPSMIPDTLRPMPIMSPGTPVTVRRLVLFEGEDEFGRLQPLLGTVDDGALLWDEPITENPMLDDVEVWMVFNATEDAHPIHQHLVAFQIMNRQKFKAKVEPNGALTNIKLVGKPRKPEDNEAGWKDTAQMYPGELTRVIAKYDREGRYVWHCHILSHEDHEMMRPYCVGDIENCVIE
jgi:spore coat protein A